MTRPEVQACVIDVLVAVIDAIGAQRPKIDDDTRPIGTFPNFDSILAEDTTVELFERLGLDPALDVNPFIKASRAATVAEVVDKLCELLPSGGTS